jgi:hypothetical protein
MMPSAFVSGEEHAHLGDITELQLQASLGPIQNLTIHLRPPQCAKSHGKGK